MSTNATSSTPGPAPVSDEFFGQSILPVAITTILLSTLFVGMRFWSRTIILRVAGLEEWLLLFGWLCAIATSASINIQSKHGLGRHFNSLSPDEAAFTVNVFYAFCLTFVKVSVLCLYLRALNYHYVRVAAKVILAIVLITQLFTIGTVLSVCQPLDAFWDFSKRPTAHCHPYAIYWSHAGMNIITDFLICVLPLTVMHKLRVPRGQKIALCFVFVLGFGACFISLGRTLQFLHGITMADRDTVVIATWTMAEVHIAVICACWVTIKPLLIRLFPLLFSPSQTDEGDGMGSNEIETIGRARQRRHDPLDIEITNTGMELEKSSKPAESVGMVDIEALKGVDRPAGNGSLLQDMDKARVRLEKSYDSLGRPAVAGHSVL